MVTCPALNQPGCRRRETPGHVTTGQEKAMYLHPYMNAQLGRERQRVMLEQAERDRLASQLRAAAKAARQSQRAERPRSAGWLAALRPSARLQ
jgi:hypothetical protein